MRKPSHPFYIKLLLLGEGVNRLSETFKETHLQVPFAKIRGMRNRVTHEYKEIELEIIWEAIQKDIPELITQFTPLISTEEN